MPGPGDTLFGVQSLETAQETKSFGKRSVEQKCTVAILQGWFTHGYWYFIACPWHVLLRLPMVQPNQFGS